MQELIALLHSGGYSCVAANQSQVRTFTRQGVADLYDLLQNEPTFLRGALVADKVVGKAAAALMLLGGVKQLHADIISELALPLLSNSEVEFSFGKKVPYIENRSKTGSCPLEAACRELATVEEIYPAIQNFIEEMKKDKKIKG